MSESARTLELDVRRPDAGAVTEELPPVPDEWAAFEDSYRWHDEPEPTTLSIPVAGGAQSVVVDEPVAATRSISSLMLSTRRAKATLFALAASAFAFGVNEATIVAMSSQIAAGLSIPVAQVGLLATAFALTVVLCALPLATVTRRWSRRASMTGALSLWTTGVVVAASADGLAQLATGRVMSAAAHALFWAIVAPTAASLFAPHLRARTVTTILLGAAAAGVLGTPLVTIGATAAGWSVPYWALAGVGAVLTVAILVALPPARGTGGAQQTRGDLPSGPAFARVLAVTFLVAVAMSTTWTYIVPFFTQVAGLPAAMMPALFALGGTLAVAATLAVSRFLARYAVRTVAAGAAMLVVAWALLALGQGWSALAAQAIQAAGWAVLAAALLNWALRHTPLRMEMGAATYTVTLNAGAAAGPLLGGFVVATYGTAWLPAVSLVLTLIAFGVLAGADRDMLRRVAVPRHVRLMQAKAARAARYRAAQAAHARPVRVARDKLPRRASREEMRTRRAEWNRRVDTDVRTPAGATETSKS